MKINLIVDKNSLDSQTDANIMGFLFKKIKDKTDLKMVDVNNFKCEKASININGVSLTVSKKRKKYFEINIIPHTLKLTNLKNLKVKDLINIEFDIFGKYLYEINK